MPIYEYLCSNCKARFEVLVRGQEVILCPQCNSPDPQRMFSVFGMKSGAKFTSSVSNPACTPCTAGDCSSCRM